MSAKKFDVCFARHQSLSQPFRILGSRKFDNTVSGFKALWSWLDQRRDAQPPMHVVVEATGVYHEELTYFLSQREGVVLHVLKPDQAKGYARFEGQRTKNDREDARLLARIGLQHPNLREWQAPSAAQRRLKKLTRQRAQMVTTRTATRNRLYAEQSSYCPDAEVVMRQRELIAHLNEQIKALEKSIKQTVQADATLQTSVQRMLTIHGVNMTTATVVLSETNNFELFTSSRQLTSYAGFDVVEKKSGTSVCAPNRISKRGNAHLRRALYFPAFRIVEHDAHFSRLFNDVHERSGVKMKGYVAVQRKLLVLMYTLHKNQTEYVVNYAATQSDSEGGVDQTNQPQPRLEVLAEV